MSGEDKHLKRMPPIALGRFRDRKNKKFTGKIHEFHEWNEFKIQSALRCPGGCGSAIQSLIPDHRLGVKQRKVEGTNTIIQEIHMVLAQSINYDTVFLLMKDGSKHMMPICKECAKNLKEDDLESLFAAGLEAFAFEDEEKGVPLEATKRFLNEMGRKKVLGRIG